MSFNIIDLVKDQISDQMMGQIGGLVGGDSAQTSSALGGACLLYTSPSPRDATLSRMPSSA